MYLEVKNLKKSYGENGSYMQVLKGISTGVEKGEMCVIQGTSGSPVIQNGKIIGAITHVFVQDPTRGYGILIEDMLGH